MPTFTLSLWDVSSAVYGILAFGCGLHLKRAFQQVVSNKLKGNVLKIVKVTLDCSYTESVVCRLRLVCPHNFKTFSFRQPLIYSLYYLCKIFDRKLLLFKWKTPIKSWLPFLVIGRHRRRLITGQHIFFLIGMTALGQQLKFLRGTLNLYASLVI